VSSPFPLTDLQQGYLVGMSSMIELGGFRPTHYMELDVAGFDQERAEAALNRLMERHEHLRTVVLPDGGQQVLEITEPIRLPVVDLSGMDSSGREAAIAATRDRLRADGVDPLRWPLFEVLVHRIRPYRAHVHIALSLLLLDGRGIRQLVREWLELYRDPAVVLPPVTTTYRAARLALAEREQTDAYREQWRYWAGRLDTLPEAPALPLAGALEAVRPVRFTRRTCSLDAAAWRRLRAAAGAHRMLPATALLHAFAETIGAWAATPHFCLNVLHQTWSEASPEWKMTVGQFGATLALEVDQRGDLDYWARGQRLQRQLWKDLAHAEVSAVRVMREVAGRRGWRPRAMLPYVFTSMLSSAGHTPMPPGPACRTVGTYLCTPQVLIDNQIQDGPDGGVECVWDVVDDAFPPGLPDAMFESYRRLLGTLTAPAPPSRVDLVSAAHRAVVERVNETAGPLPAGRLEDGFLRRAAVDPGAIALVTSERTMSYGELEAASRAVAAAVRVRGAGRGDLIPVVMAKGWEQVAAIIGVLRAGAAYCPVDSGLPAGRIRQLVAECRAPVMLGQHGGPAGTQPGEHGLPSALVVGDLPDASGPVPSGPGDAGDLAYVIYTSGSTGQPKGVEIEHQGAVNTIADVNARIGLGPGDRVFGISALSFDLSVWDIFGTLSAGATLVLPDPSPRPDPEGWATASRRHGVTVWNSVPALAEMLQEVAAQSPEPVPPVRAFLLSGDWISGALVGRLRRLWPDARVIAMGGATEASIWSNVYEIGRVDPAWHAIPYGYPMANQTMRVLDGRLEPRPPWAIGQIYIGGAGLARGYRDDPARTAERFICHPVTGERLYRTGDLGRYWPDGTIEFLGREDRQLKIQGFRIEPGEIETAVRCHPAVRDCLVRGETAPGGSRRLVALVVPEPAGQPERLTSDDILAHLRARLPYYMVPGQLHVVPRLPLTANGKVEMPSATTRSKPPVRRMAASDPALGAQMTRLAALWADLLDLPEVGPDDDFFALGGNSLLALRLVHRARAELGMVFEFGQVFQAPTVRAMTASAHQGEREPSRAVTLSVADGPDLFLFHPVGGSVVSYLPLAQAWDGPVRAFQSAALTDPSASAAATSLTAMAAGYLTELCRIRSGGPYLLGGWSMGGVLAYEVARQLAVAGERAWPFMIDSVPGQPGRRGTVVMKYLEFLTDLGAGRLAPGTAAALSATAPAELARAARDAAVTGGLLPPEIGVPDFERLAATHAANLASLGGYTPGPFDGPALLFVAGQADRPDPVPAWRAVCPRLTVRTLSCDHYTVVAGRWPAVIAEAVRTWSAGLKAPLVPVVSGKGEVR
jgi:amino acid adenylation domain-containing protein